MSVIECKQVTKVFKNVRALDDLSFTLAENKITGLIGRNGAGKTTLLKMISGLIRHTSGDITVFGEQPFNSLLVSANSIFISADLHFSETLTLQDILEAASTFYENWDADFAQKLVNYFSLQPTQYHRDLSTGMKSTFNMILGLSSRCPLTIFDEPTTGMDAAVRKDFYRALLKDYLSFPRSIVISSHHLNEIDHLIEDILLLNDGKVHLHLPVHLFKEWAIGVRGKTRELTEWLKTKEVIHRKNIGKDEQFVVIKDDLDEIEMDQAKMNQFTFQTISSSDLAIYLTSTPTRGIDDVFCETETV